MKPYLIAFLALSLLGDAAHAEPQTPGERFSVDPATLPAPDATPSVDNHPDIVKCPDGVMPLVPQGFTASILTSDVPYARNLVLAPNGDIFVARSKDGIVSVVRESTTGKPAAVTIFAKGFDRPYGIAFHAGAVYIADGRGVFRTPYAAGDTTASAEPVQITPKGAFGDTGGPGGHWTRNLIFAPDGKHFFVSIGSKNNIGEDPMPRASIQEFNEDGSGQKTFANGIRNPVGLAFYPGTNDLYTVVNERDGLGDGLVPDYFTRVQEGAFYGWPYAYLGQHPQPDYAEKRPDLVTKTVMPDVLFDSHSAPLGLTFYEGHSFPAKYRGAAFVTMHGSWNKANPTGYKVVMVPFENGRPKNEYYNFVTGFRLETQPGDPAKAWARPVGIAVDRDGSLLVSEDEPGTIWKISYKGQ